MAAPPRRSADRLAISPWPLVSSPRLVSWQRSATIFAKKTGTSSTIAAWIYRDQAHKLDIEQGLTKAGLHRAEEAEHKAARFLGCEPHEVIFGPNMTSLNFALSRTAARARIELDADQIALAGPVGPHQLPAPHGWLFPPPTREAA